MILLAPKGIKEFLGSVQNPEENTEFLTIYCSLQFQCFELPIPECSTLIELGHLNSAQIRIPQENHEIVT